MKSSVISWGNPSHEFNIGHCFRERCDNERRPYCSNFKIEMQKSSTWMWFASKMHPVFFLRACRRSQCCLHRWPWWHLVLSMPRSPFLQMWVENENTLIYLAQFDFDLWMQNEKFSSQGESQSLRLEFNYPWPVHLLMSMKIGKGSLLRRSSWVCWSA